MRESHPWLIPIHAVLFMTHCIQEVYDINHKNPLKKVLLSPFVAAAEEKAPMDANQ